MSETNDGSNWHQDFIASNLLVIGYNAWAGHLSQKRGAIVCSTNSPTLGVGGESFKTHFVGRSRLAPFLNAWLAAPDTAILHHHFMIDHILEVVDNYDPTTEVVLLLESFDLAFPPFYTVLNLRCVVYSVFGCFVSVYLTFILAIVADGDCYVLICLVKLIIVAIVPASFTVNDKIIALIAVITVP
ncbi:hypothetical protein [Dapis sp. BLCC M229]|uniref:hypothetical protein n=1 Tax=Dapis sp. BLCC M229 TaxID=3400188 RepID=UPI003CE758B1